MQKTIKVNQVPAPSIVNWWKDSIYFQNATIVGRSLKYIRSGSRKLIFTIPSSDFIIIAKHFNDGGNLGNVENWFCNSNELRLELLLNDKWYLTFLVQEDSDNKNFLNTKDDNHQLYFSFEELYFTKDNSEWQGPKLALADLAKNLMGLHSEYKIPAEPLSIEALLGCIVLAARLNMNFPAELWSKIKEESLPEDIKNLSQRKSGKLFKRIMLSAKPSRAFLNLQELKMLIQFIPELSKGDGLIQNRYHKHDIFHHCIYTCDAVDQPDLGLRLAALFHDLGKVDTRKEKGNGEASFHNHELVSVKHAREIMYRFGLAYDKQLFKRVIFLVRNHMFHYTQEWTDKAVRRFIQKVGSTQMNDLLTLRLADRKGSGKHAALPKAIDLMMKHIDEVRLKEAELKIKDLEIDGHDLIKMGIPKGPIMGDLLKSLLEEVKSEKLENEYSSLQKKCQELINELSLQNS